jgi:hypothetical protein
MNPGFCFFFFDMFQFLLSRFGSRLAAFRLSNSFKPRPLFPQEPLLPEFSAGLFHPSPFAFGAMEGPFLDLRPRAPSEIIFQLPERPLKIAVYVDVGIPKKSSLYLHIEKEAA